MPGRAQSTANIQGAHIEAPSALQRKVSPSVMGSGRMAQLAAMINQSPRVQAQFSAAAEIQNSDRVRQLSNLSAEMNGGQPEASQPGRREETPADQSNRPEQKEPVHSPAAPIAQLRQIPDVDSLAKGVKQQLDIGEKTAGSKAGLLSQDRENVEKLTHSYTPSDGGQRSQQALTLEGYKGNKSVESWYDQVDGRIRSGAEETAGDALFWAKDIQERPETGADEVTVDSMHLLGAELHDRGLGPARVVFILEALQTPPRIMTAIIKPENRSIEKAILGAGDSVATRLNRRVGIGRRVNTLNMDVHESHGTIVEDVKSGFGSLMELRNGLQSTVESVLRKVRIWDSAKTVTTETIGFALLTGLYDLHKQNVMYRGSAPVLIDADVALRPKEFEGPSKQEAFGNEETGQIKTQLSGGQKVSDILQYAMDHPKEVIDSITELIGDHKARIVPVFTPNWQFTLSAWLESLAKEEKKKEEEEEGESAEKLIWDMAREVLTGTDGSPGLQGELGDDRGDRWDQGAVAKEIKKDFNLGQVPHFQYQPRTGRVFYHGVIIWQGTTLEESMEKLHARLTNSKKEK